MQKSSRMRMKIHIGSLNVYRNSRVTRSLSIRNLK
jgi:hypothetical protein